ncbi:ABC transporter [Hyperthermus butylicus]|uniref:ABC-type transporter protein (ATP binding cassette) n=1 Tax=Hyperthermus butylicus (strain DSM 5456 / JCM 9403 / PLM1-5) TaxID=415426 RepID=A2BJI8_HYPBU|nr:ABC transporter [Hyperthermus butylicus]ABM80149.1 ABC-type transporter protein (ATP binding cassette) [Hyperthermus butylicus DSM 5456]
MDLLGGDIDTALEVLRDLGLEPVLLQRRKPWQLSAGQLKAYTTAAALASKTSNVLLDEPFEQLDPARKLRMLRRLRSYQGTLVLSTHETWVLNQLRDWSVYIMFSGRLYGPVEASRLAKARIVAGRRADALLVVETGEGSVSFVESGEGRPVSEILTLDRVYELFAGSAAS